MPQKIVECIPNFSEGTNKQIIEALKVEIETTKGVRLLDYSWDPDHNRSVFTFIGESQPVSEAAFKSAAKAIKLIDIFKHKGVHPKIGAVDVIPFVPLKNITLEECVEIAKQTGKRIGEELDVPVYLYEEATTCAEHKNLANLRRGGFKELKEQLYRRESIPDFGPGKLHPKAGAVIVGARDFLIAFNINLETAEVEIAKEIAKKLRTLPSIKAIGVPLESKGIVQVSMNLVDFKKTGLKAAFDAVAEETQKINIKITNSEIIGLIPKAATFPNMKDYLKLEEFSDKKVLESYL